MQDEHDLTRQPSKQFQKAKLRQQKKALEDDQALQKQQLAEMQKMRRSRDATEPVVRQRLDLLFDDIPGWRTLVPEAKAFVGSDDPGLLFQLSAPAEAVLQQRGSNDLPATNVTQLKLDEAERELLLHLGRAAAGTNNCVAGMDQNRILRPTFCRLILDLEVCDQESLYYHWCVAKFDKQSSTDFSTPHRFVPAESFGQLLEVVLGRRFTESNKEDLLQWHVPLAQAEAEQRRRRCKRLVDRYAANQGNRLAKDEARLLADPVLSQLRNLDVTRQFPPLGMSPMEYQSLVESQEDVGTPQPKMLSERERLASAEAKIAVQLQVLDMLCEPEAIQFMQKFFPLLSTLFDAYHDMSEERVRSLIPAESDFREDRKDHRLPTLHSVGTVDEASSTMSPAPVRRQPKRTKTEPVVVQPNDDEPDSPVDQNNNRYYSDTRRSAHVRQDLHEDQSDASSSCEDEPQITGHMNFPCFLQFCSIKKRVRQSWTQTLFTDPFGSPF
jgi:hypothetical protein